MLRCLLLAVPAGQTSLNKWAADLKTNRVLRILTGLDDDEAPPGVGTRVRGHSHIERRDCAKLYTDPDAEWGWENHRDEWFFGHHFYEISCSASGHDLPLAPRLDPGNGNGFTASPQTLTHLRKTPRSRTEGWGFLHLIADRGHDAQPIHRHLVDLDVMPIIPLKTAARATHPTRQDVHLSERGMPTCQAGLEMTHWGSASKGRTNFMCPLKAGKIEHRPLAPVQRPGWHCRPELKWGPTTVIAVNDNPRFLPFVPRNTERYRRLDHLRSGGERSNAVKKETFNIEGAKHRRAFF